MKNAWFYKYLPLYWPIYLFFSPVSLFHFCKFLLIFSLLVICLLFIGTMGSTELCFYRHCVVVVLLQMTRASSGINLSLTPIALAILSMPVIVRNKKMDRILRPLFLRFLVTLLLFYSHHKYFYQSNLKKKAFNRT